MEKRGLIWRRDNMEKRDRRERRGKIEEKE